ncbi:6,7-dimethyl-8-ribityllumazine synthase [Candidatus Hodgkinia cicadicola]|uniref:6,7-dimethyl-8-ribityllumazine synthase n=1 Tax=Candidatus Hodgkinia cicadicola TaxID=573658 RepID=A0ABX4MF07_9HYPH|nr:6,7-dimethyl-8-ribityllumazine synthase [Candidatus Hodgkinia cicadicola]PIM96542.1 6,7-dimethyl-8-ribityllumazine synthase [Candidatus Hodgkinia cicadicola]
MLFITRFPTVLILSSRYNTFISDLSLDIAIKSIKGIFAYEIQWYYGIFELEWLIRQSSSKYHAIIVLGSSIKHTTNHYKWIARPCYQTLINYPIVNMVFVSKTPEQAWLKVINLDNTSILYPVASLIGSTMLILV